MAEYGVEYLKRLQDSVAQFESSFNAWMATQVEKESLAFSGLMPTVWTKDDADPAEVKRLELDVARTSGLAGRAVSVTGAYIYVAGHPPLDPITNWFIMSEPRALISPRDVRMTAGNVKGRLESMINDAEFEDQDAIPTFSPARLHRVVWSNAAEQWTAHHYRIAVREAAEGLTLFWREKLGRMDVDGRKFWQQTLSPGEPKSGQPKLVWPGDAADMSVKSMQNGLCPLATSLKELAEGLASTVRNATTHTTSELSEQEAMERLAAYSYLARLLDECDVRLAEEDAQVTDV